MHVHHDNGAMFHCCVVQAIVTLPSFTQKKEEDKLYVGRDSILYDLQVKFKYVHLQEYVKYLSC